MTPIEEIKSKISIEQLIGEYVPLKQAGTNFKGLCPFHQEKTPSFMVSAEKQIWHCFGCNEGGDAFSFLQKYEGVDFREAAETLARRTGVVLRGFKRPDQSRKKVLYDLNDMAQKFYAAHVHSDAPDAVKTRQYLTSRGLSTESIDAWGIGLAPDGWDDLVRHSAGLKFQESDAIEAGLLVAREGKVFDRFRKRLMFPIRDAQGKVVAFTARTLQYITHTEDEQAGKYVNSPQTPIYNKSQILYGFDFAKRSIKRQDYAIIVEGNLDVILSHQVGVKNAVAVSGTALTAEQLRILARYTKNIMLSFDADTAGSQAVFRGITLAWEHDMNVKVIILTEGKDPADTILADPEKWKEAVRKSIGVVDFYFDQVFARVDLSRADHKKLAAQKITGIISQLKTKLEQAHYIKLLASKLGTSEEMLWPMVKAEKTSEQPEELVPVSKKTPRSVAEHLIGFISTHPSFTEKMIDEIEPEMITSDLQDLYKKIIIHYTKQQSANFRDLSSQLGSSELQTWSQLVFLGEQVYQTLTPAEQEHELSQLMKRTKYLYYTLKLKDITSAIKLAEREGNSESIENLMREYHAMSVKRGN